MSFLVFIVQVLSKYIARVEFNKLRNHFFIFLRSGADLRFVLRFFYLHSNCQFQCLSDLYAADFLGKSVRFRVSYSLLSLRYTTRIVVHYECDGDVASIVDLYRAAGWLEREVWDMFGITFSGNLDLRRILTDYGFVGFPLRKDFPLTGYIEVRYDDTLKRLVYEPVELNQGFRFFELRNVWY